MKKIIILLIIVFTNCKISYGQTYHPMLADSNSWYVYRVELGFSITDKYFANSDTVLNGLHYKKMDNLNNINSSFFIREDSLNRKVYALPNSALNSVTDSTELILYDFSLHENDSIYLFDPINHDSIGMYYVDSIRSTNTIAGLRKAFYLKSHTQTNYFDHPIWVEGIGSLGDPIIRQFEPYWQMQLTCFFRNDMKAYQSQMSIDYNDCDIAIGIENYITNDLINLFPNPANTHLNIDIPYPANYVLTVFDVLGKQLIQQSNTKTIDLNGLKEGVYLLKIGIADKIIAKRFVISNN